MTPGIVRTYSGQQVDVANPDPASINIIDIAHQLSLECRWGGACRRHYSVAEHSIHVARFARRICSDKDEAALHGLLHDAHEAYLKDLPTPIKMLVGPAYRSWCNGLDVAIRSALGVGEPSEEVIESVHLADKWAAWVEGKMLTKGYETGVEPPEEVVREASISMLNTPGNIEQAYLRFLQFHLKVSASHQK